MAKFRHKQTLVDAVQLLWSTWSEVCELADVGKFEDGHPEGCYVDAAGHVVEDGNGRMALKVPAGHPLVANLAYDGDWLVRNVDGELDVYTPDVFAMMFESADDPNQRKSSEFHPDWSQYPILASLVDGRQSVYVVSELGPELHRLLVDARADAVQFVHDVRADELAKARADERKRIRAMSHEDETLP